MFADGLQYPLKYLVNHVLPKATILLQVIYIHYFTCDAANAMRLKFMASEVSHSKPLRR